MSHHSIVYAVHNFEAENEDEINFMIGEPITVLEKDEKYLDGWWQGKNLRGETGLFPMNYTSTEKPENYIEPKEEEEQEEEQEEEEEAKDQLLQLPPMPLTSTTTESYMLSPHLSSRSSGSTVEDEIDQAISQLEISASPIPTHTASTTIRSDNNNKIEAWDVEQVADWLNSVGLDSVSANFIDQEITGDILLDLNIEALKELGINTFGKRYKVMQAISLLKESYLQETQTQKQPIPNTSVSTSAIISRPASRRSIPTSLRKSNSQSIIANTSNDDVLYKFPRKAPLPPGETNRPLSPTSLNTSSNVSRSNTFNTVSSGNNSLKSNTTRDMISPDPTISKSSSNGYQSPRRVLSQRSQHTFDSLDKEMNNDWNTETNNHNNSNEFHNSVTNISNNNVSPLNTPTTSTSTPRQPMQISNAHKLSVSSFDEQLSTRASTTEAFQAPEHEGWLHKQSDKYKTWNKRWFVLKGSNLFYFKSPKDVRMKGIINLRGYKIIVDESIHAGKYCFKAQHDRERTFYFYTDTEESMRVWLKMLMKTTIARDFRAPVMSSNHIATVSLDVARRMRPRPPSVIMYKNQKQLKLSNDPKMGVMLEEEEVHHNLDLTHKQTRESGITVLHTNNHQREEEMIPELPSQYPTHLIEQQQQQQQTQQSQMLLNDEEEDLIDPQHRSLPLSSSLSMTSSLSNNSNITSGDEWGISEYIDWINRYLPNGKKAIDLTSAFRNGDTLILLLEAISGKEVRRPPVQKGGSMSVMMLDNIVAAFKFMGREGVEVDGRYTIKDVFGGNEMKIITMLDAIKYWADMNYPQDDHLVEDLHDDLIAKKSNTSVLIGKNSGWRGSAMMDQRHPMDENY